MKMMVLFTLFFAQILMAQLQVPSCAEPINQTIIENIAHDLIASKFQKLHDYKFEIEFFKSDAYFLATWVKAKDLLKNPKKRTYILRINENLYDCPPPHEALVGIMAHELQHLLDYTKMNGSQLVGLLSKIGLSKKQRAKYERATDLHAMELGFAEGLIGYREWIYERLNAKDLKTKKYFYWTPEEIQDWIDHQTNPISE